MEYIDMTTNDRLYTQSGNLKQGWRFIKETNA
jgi:hypothetical protein